MCDSFLIIGKTLHVLGNVCFASAPGMPPSKRFSGCQCITERCCQIQGTCGLARSGFQLLGSTFGSSTPVRQRCPARSLFRGPRPPHAPHAPHPHHAGPKGNLELRSSLRGKAVKASCLIIRTIRTCPACPGARALPHIRRRPCGCRVIRLPLRRFAMIHAETVLVLLALAAPFAAEAGPLGKRITSATMPRSDREPPQP